MADQRGILLQMVIIATAAILQPLKPLQPTTYPYVRIILIEQRECLCKAVQIFVLMNGIILLYNKNVVLSFAQQSYLNLSTVQLVRVIWELILSALGLRARQVLSSSRLPTKSPLRPLKTNCIDIESYMHIADFKNKSIYLAVFLDLSYII